MDVTSTRILNNTIFVVFFIFIQCGSICNGKDYSYISKPSYDKLKKLQNQEPVYGLGETGAIIIGSVVGGVVFFAIVLTIILVCVLRRHGYCLCESQSDRQEPPDTVSYNNKELVVKYPFIKKVTKDVSMSEPTESQHVVKYPLVKT